MGITSDYQLFTWSDFFFWSESALLASVKFPDTDDLPKQRFIFPGLIICNVQRLVKLKDKDNKADIGQLAM